MATVARARDVRFSYGRRTVFRHLDLDVPVGLTGLLGPNGAGKSTLCNMLSTFATPRGGSLEILGLEATRHTDLRQIRQRIGYLPQHFGYYPSFTVQEFVEYAGWLKQVPNRSLRDAAVRAIERVDLMDQRPAKLKSLSGGMLRRVGIAHALVHGPEFLILDEPTAGLDPQQRIEFRALLRRLQSDASVLISTHLVEDVAAVCERLVVLNDGVVAYTGAVSALLDTAQENAAGATPLERGYSALIARSGSAPTTDVVA